MVCHVINHRFKRGHNVDFSKKNLSLCLWEDLNPQPFRDPAERDAYRYGALFTRKFELFLNLKGRAAAAAVQPPPPYCAWPSASLLFIFFARDFFYLTSKTFRQIKVEGITSTRMATRV